MVTCLFTYLRLHTGHSGKSRKFLFSFLTADNNKQLTEVNPMIDGMAWYNSTNITRAQFLNN